MKPISLLVLMALIWAATHFWWVPLVSQRWKAGSLREKVARAGILAVLEKLRDLALVACITLTLVVVLVALANLFAASSSSAAAILRASESMYAAAKTWNEKYALALTWISLIGVVLCLFLAARRARRRVVHVWTEKANEVLEGFGHTLHLEEARADPALQPLVEALDTAIAQFHALREADDVDQDALENKRAQISVYLNMLAMEIAAKDLDVEAALSARTPQEQEEAATATPTFWSRLRGILTSDRLAKDLGLVRKPLSYVMTGLLVLSLVGWTAEPMANSLRLAVNNLRVNVLAEQTNRELQAVSAQAATPAPPPPSPPSQDADAAGPPVLPPAREVARLLAHAATNDVLRANLLRAVATPDAAAAAANTRRAAAASRADLVRAALLDVTPADISAGRAYDNLDAARTAGKVQAEAAADLAGHRPGVLAETTAPFRTRVEEQILPDLEQLRRKDPGAFGRLAQRAAARYATPISALDAQAKIMGEMIGQTFRSIDAGPTGEAAKQGQRLLKEFGEKSFNTWAVSEAKRYVTDEIVAAARPEVLQRLNAQPRARFAFAGSEWADKLATELGQVDGPEKQWTGSSAAMRESRMLAGVKGAADDILPQPRGTDAEGMRFRQAAMERVNALQDYDALFPSAMNPDTGGGGGGGGGHAAPHRTSSAGSGPIRRPATSFHRARVSYIVRGVIIGRELTGPDLDIGGLRWQVNKKPGAPTRVHLELMEGSQWKSLGDFDAAVVNQALRYAADQRVIATTIVPGDGVVVMRTTNTHPALIDTPLGCRVIELDRFVDTVSASEPVPARLATLSGDREQMWRWLDRAETLQRIALADVDDPKECVEAISGRTAQHDTAIRFSPVLAQSLSRFTSGLQGQHQGNASWLEAVHACDQSSGKALAGCLCEQGMKTKLGTGYWFPEDHTSQVREKDARLAPELAWLDRSPDRMGVLDFAVHTTFAVRSPETGEPVDEDWAEAYDFPPSEILALRTALRGWIPGYIAGSGGRHAPVARSYEDFMAPLEDFVLLQRLFRAGFAGQLGDDFPLALLPQLQRETRAFVPAQPTVRWELGGIVDEDLFTEKLKARNPDAETAYSAWARDRDRRILARAPTCDAVSK